ncbi:hypothetical protein YC2023_030098 [Brassica napus]
MGLAMEPSLDLVLILSSHWYMIQEIGARPLATMQILTHGKRAEKDELPMYSDHDHQLDRSILSFVKSYKAGLRIQGYTLAMDFSGCGSWVSDCTLCMSYGTSETR